MSEAVAKDEAFLQAFDRLVDEVVVPRMKRRLIDAGAASEDETLSFYIQRPPTLRLQPGPGRVGTYCYTLYHVCGIFSVMQFERVSYSIVSSF